MALGSPNLTHSEAERNTTRGMAYFAGSGPAGKTCGDCKHRGYQRERSYPNANGAPVFYRSTGCAMFKKLSGRHGPPIDAALNACKYFEGK